MGSTWHAGPGRLLTAAEAAEALGGTAEGVAADAAAGHLTWVEQDGVTLYPEDVVAALAARRVPPPPADPLITRAHAADILGIGRSGASGILTRDPQAAGTRAYRLSAVLALKAERDARPVRHPLSPERIAAMQAARRRVQR